MKILFPKKRSEDIFEKHSPCIIFPGTFHINFFRAICVPALLAHDLQQRPKFFYPSHKQGFLNFCPKKFFINSPSKPYSDIELHTRLLDNCYILKWKKKVLIWTIYNEKGRKKNPRKFR